jgi:hypothetical protein
MFFKSNERFEFLPDLDLPEDFNQKQYEIIFDPGKDEFTARDRMTDHVYNVTPHAMAVLVNEDYRRAVFATHIHVARTFN